jgi:FAD synthase
MRFLGHEVEHYYCAGCGDEFLAESSFCPDCQETCCVMSFSDHVREQIFGTPITYRLSELERRIQILEAWMGKNLTAEEFQRVVDGSFVKGLVDHGRG